MRSSRRVLQHALASTHAASELAPSIPIKKFHITFAGNDEFSRTVLEGLVAAQDVWHTIHVVTNADRACGRNGHLLQISPVRTFADKLGLHSSLLEQTARIKDLRLPVIHGQQPGGLAAHVLITASFGRIIPRSILSCFFRDRRFNVHPSLLPLLRGPAPIQHAIAQGHPTTGVSIAGIEPFSTGIDSGEIWNQDVVSIRPGETFVHLRSRLAQRGAYLLVESLRAIIRGTASSLPQDHEKASFAPRIDLRSSQIDPMTWDAFKIERYHRGIGHQKSLRLRPPFLDYAQLQLKEFYVRSPPHSLSSSLHSAGEGIYDRVAKELIIRCANHTEIAITKVQQEGRRMLGVREWVNGLNVDKNSPLDFRLAPVGYDESFATAKHLDSFTHPAERFA